MLSKVKGVQGSGDFDMEINGNTVKLYSFEYEMEDGTVLKANHKTSTSPFPTGSEVDYEVTKTHPEYGNSGKVKKPDTGNYSNPNASKPQVNDDARQLMIVRQSSLNRAVEILIHNATCSGNRSEVDEVEAIELASSLTKWVMGAEPKAQPEKVAEAVASSTIGEGKKKEENPLPF